MKNPKRATGCNCGGKIPRKFPKIKKTELPDDDDPIIRNPEDDEFLDHHQEREHEHEHAHAETSSTFKKRIANTQRISLGFLPSERRIGTLMKGI